MTVKGGEHTDILAPIYRINPAVELGLSSEQIRISPVFYHYDLKADSFGPNVPPEVLWMNAECRIDMTLVHYDTDILDTVIAESMGGGVGTDTTGSISPPGRPMGGYRRLYTSGCHFMTMGITSNGGLQAPYRFLACYLATPPVEIPMGTHHSLVKCNWRAIPYFVPGENTPLGSPVSGLARFGELICSGVRLWDREGLNVGD